MADQLERAFRDLADAPEAAGLPAPPAVRRRGDRRRRSARASAVVAVAILAVGTVGVVDATRTQADRGNQTVPADSPTALSATPLLAAGDIPAIGPYTHFQVGGASRTDEPFQLQNLVTGLTVASAWPGARQIERHAFPSDLDAEMVETVALFTDEDSAASVASSFPTAGGVDGPNRETTWQSRALPMLQGSQRGLVSIPRDDAGISYIELAVAREGRIVVVLEWSSMGLPHGEDAETAQTWQWAIPDDLIAAALNRATD